MFGTIAVSILPIIAIVGFVGAMWWLKKEGDSGEGYFFALLIGGFIIVLAFLPVSMCYGSMISLPYKYQASCSTYEETLDLLMRFDNMTIQVDLAGQLGSIGQGLESQWLKQRLNEAIEEKNNLWAKIKACQINPWQPFRYLLDGVEV